MTTGEAILLSCLGLAFFLTVGLVVGFQRRRAVARFVQEQKQRAESCAHGKRRADCFYCVDGGREDLADESDDEIEIPYVPEPPPPLPGILPIRFDFPIEFARVEFSTDDVERFLRIGRQWADGTMDELEVRVAPCSINWSTFGEWPRPLKAIFIKPPTGLTRIRIWAAGRLFIDADPRVLALAGGVL